jgi:hypothetical protein
MQRRGEERSNDMEVLQPQKQEIIQQMGGAAMIRMTIQTCNANKSLVCNVQRYGERQKYDSFEMIKSLTCWTCIC